MTRAEEPGCTLSDVTDNAVLLPALRVRVTAPDGTMREAPLGMETLVVGTSAECDLVVSDPRVSRRHCELRLTRKGVVLRDLGSKNGTLIGDLAVMEVLLPLGTVVTLAGSRLSTHLAGAPSIVSLSTSTRFGEAIGESLPMRALFAALERAAASSETVLLLGESGTGKEVLARAIHAASPRKDGPFVVFDCSAVAPSLIEAELFGHARGAFTGAVSAHAGLLEQADRGTLFIDELGELPLDLQPKLLRALEARQVRRVGAVEWRPFDARIVAATHRDLRARVAEKSFREDLYYRLAVVEVNIPPLRERKDDIPALVERFLAAQTPKRTLADLPPHAMSLLLAHDWPGNVRELRNVVARLCLFPDFAVSALGAQARKPPAAAAPEPARSPEPAAAAPAAAPEAHEAPAGEAEEGDLGGLLGLPLLSAREMVLERFERQYLATKLREHGGNISRTAEAISVSRQFLHKLVDRYGLRSSAR
ncbi:sigma 54-interacting transcriptional regulator [Polyangium jinanense]|uniref:Sigma 54-interacting transcriptional regulator n=1 Tax=Polyangium jinanense TaxID=2829994 RepID=A0A9X3XH46_9BACT|nr:sigma 54-interacting transcriptional regulator [Polyangium jinanense]MDC3961470.1 sigma 54-interacting transcriptional regulator [Polyangium jinanense]MDC3987901.1 sigma 54-interacting transcriptional regulator [Polyangium jinanense]